MSIKLLIIDNYDSFTYNLVQYCREYLPYGEIDVFRNDQINLTAIQAYDAIVLSPGPGLPKEAGLLIDIIERYASQKPILGVCLGHQAIATVFGATLHNLTQVCHGIATTIDLVAPIHPLFRHINEKPLVGRYHSWVVDRGDFPEELDIIATDTAGHIMALSHKDYPVIGVQFHPESILTPDGKQIIHNFLSIVEQTIIQH